MNPRRRNLIALAGAILVKPGIVAADRGDSIDVTLKVTDEAGRPLGHSTIWQYALPSSYPTALDGTDLWRITTRYAASFEQAARYHPIVQSMRIPPMADVQGIARMTVDYRRLEGSDFRPSARKSLGFTVMKRGYRPGRVDFIEVSDSELSATVTLRADAPSLPRYLQDFDRLRWEASDTRRVERFSVSQHEELEQRRAAMESAAAMALAAGDKLASSRIYARMRYLPAIRFIAGKPAGFAQTDPDSQQARSYLAKAYEADSSSGYVAAEYLLTRGVDEFRDYWGAESESRERRRRFRDFLDELHSLAKSRGAEMWPGHHRVYALWHLRSDDPEERSRAVPLLESLYALEPKFQVRETLLGAARITPPPPSR